MSHDATILFSIVPTGYLCYQRDASDYTLVSSGLNIDGERICAAALLPLFIPSVQNNRMLFCLALGYTSGYIRVFDTTGKTLLETQCHTAPVTKIKFRPLVSLEANDGDELTVLFGDKIGISIDGNSLWMALRVNVLEPDNKVNTPPPLTFRKWFFGNQSVVTDLMSLGPIEHPVTFAPQFNLLTGSYRPTSFTSRYIASGLPMVCLYGTSEMSKPATLPTQPNVTTAVASVVSFAKSFWTAPAADTHETQEGSSVTKPMPIAPLLTLKDTQRMINLIRVAPPPPTGGQSHLAALSDSLGRIMTFDTNEFQIVRIWKGMRDSQMGWIQLLHKSTESGSLIPMLFLVLYSARGVLEVYKMRHGKRIAMIQVGTGYQLVQSAVAVVGGVYWRLPDEELHQKLSKCFLISPTGEVKDIVLDGDQIVKMLSVTSMVQSMKLLVSKYSLSPESTREPILEQMTKTLAGIKDSRLRSRALEAFNDSIPIRFMLEMIEMTLREAGAFDTPNGADIFSTQLSTSGVKHSTELKVRIDLLLGRHVLQTLLNLEKMHGSVLESDEPNLPQVIVDSCNSHFASLEKPSPPVVNFFVCGPVSFIHCFSLEANAHEGGMCLKLTEMEEDTRVKLAKTLCYPFFALGHSIKETYLSLNLSPRDWIALLMKFVKLHPFSSLAANRLQRDRVASNIVFLLKLNLDDPLAIKMVLDFIQNSIRIGHALFLYVCLDFCLSSLEPPVSADLKAVGTALKHIKDSIIVCWHLQHLISSKVHKQLGLCALLYGKTETTCPSRIVALQDIVYDVDHVNDKTKLVHLKAEFREKIQTRIGPFHEDLVLVYTSFEHAANWSETLKLGSLKDCVASVKRMNIPIIQWTTGVTLFSEFLGPKLVGIIDMIDKTRRVPKEAIFIRMCGMTLQHANAFLLECTDLLDILDSDDPDQTELTASHYVDKLKAFVIDLLPSLFTSSDSYFNDAVGLMIQGLSKREHLQRHFSRHLLQQHFLMIQILQVILKLDLKVVKPLKLFPLDLTFGSTFFVEENANGLNLEQTDPRLSAERVSFLTRIAEIDKTEASVMANAFGIQSLRLFSSDSPSSKEFVSRESPSMDSNRESTRESPRESLNE